MNAGILKTGRIPTSSFVLCRGRESNSHSLRNTILSRARLTNFATPALPVQSLQRRRAHVLLYPIFEAWEGFAPSHISFADRRVDFFATRPTVQIYHVIIYSEYSEQCPLREWCAVAYNARMGKMEDESKKRTRKNDIKRLVLGTVAAAGLISIALVAPNVIGALGKLGFLPSRRQREYVNASRARLLKQGLIKYEKGFVRLTEKGGGALRALELQNYAQKRPRRWDRKWRVLIFDIPEYRKGLRDKVRRTLETIGFTRLQNSVWVYPYDCEDFVTLLKADFRIGKDLLYLIVDSIEGDRNLRESFQLR